ncbi:MAG: hypothetical protein J6C53_02755 [Clostridia bacterium]|nr:hypothetical protein [Clostridia bacterium]
MDKLLKKQLQKYIDSHFVDENAICRCLDIEPPHAKQYKKASYKMFDKSSSIKEFIDLVKDQQTFSQYLFSLIDESGESDAEVYTRAGIDRRLFSKIRSNSDYQPSKNTIFALAMSLKLDYTKTRKLLNKAGYDFSNNKLTDIIIMFCIENKIYDLYQIDSLLTEYNQKPIASDL